MELLIRLLKLSSLFLTLTIAYSHADPIPPPAEVTVTCFFGLNHQTNFLVCNLGAGSLNYSHQTLNIEGEHFGNMTDADVNSVESLDSLTLMYFNGEVMNKFVNLEILRLTRVGLREVGPNAFNSCARLEDFRIISASLETFPRGMLRNCQHLRRFVVDSTNISSLPGDLFGTSASLEHLTITWSRLTTVPESLFQHMRVLREVNLQRNHITTIGQFLFSNVLNLEVVSLSHNRITDPRVIVGLLSGHAGLRRLQLVNAGLSNFDFNFFAQFGALEELEISNTEFNMTSIAWSGLPPSLTLLEVWQVGEEVPENALDHLTNLRHLRIRGEAMGSFHPNTFRRLTNLNHLQLSGCGLTQVHPQLFSTLVNLNNLDLSFNAIEELPPGVFTNLVSLGLRNVDSLNIGRNKIRRLNANSFGVHPNLTNIFVSNNGLNEIEPGIFGRCFPNMEMFFSLDNPCYSGILRWDFDEGPTLDYCFANWLGLTTSTVTTTTGGSERLGAGVFTLLASVLMGISLRF